MKQSLTLIVCMLVCGALIVVLAWAPFTAALSLEQILKNSFIGFALGLLFYFLVMYRPTRRKSPKAANIVRPQSKHRKHRH